MAKKPIEQTYPASRDDVWEALRGTIADLKYKDLREDRAAGTIEFRTGLSLWSFYGQQMAAIVREAESGSTVVSLTGQLAEEPAGRDPGRIAHAGATLAAGRTGKQLTSYGEKKRIAKKVLAGIDNRLRAPVA